MTTLLWLLALSWIGSVGFVFGAFWAGRRADRRQHKDVQHWLDRELKHF